VTSSLGGSGTRYSFVPPSSETHTYDADGNLTADGRWSYTWDAENRLVSMETVSTAYAVGVPRQLIQFKYDYLGRRVRKTVSAWSGSAYVAALDRKFIYNGWNLLAEYNVPSSGVSPLASAYIWGLDLSGNLVDGGGVGGLLAIKDVANSALHLPYYDANGNLHALADRSTGTITAAYEYSPFGETLRTTGVYAATNPFRFSTKYTDAETQLLYYGYRYYNPSLGRWLGRDPLVEKGGLHLYAFCRNNAVNAYDALGMIPLRMDDIWNEDMPDADFVAEHQPTWQKVGDSSWYDPVTGIQRNYKGHSEDYYNSLVEGCPDGVQGGTTSLSFLDQINSTFSWRSSFSQQVVVAGINAVRDGAVIIGQLGSALNSGKTATSGTGSATDPTASRNNAAGSTQNGTGSNRTTIPNANDTVLGRVTLLLAQAGGQTADNVLNTLTIAAQGAQQGLRDHVGLSGDFALNILPIPRNSQFGPFPGGIGWGLSGDANFKDGITGNQNVTGGKFGASGSLGITFSIPFSGAGAGGQSVNEITFSGGAGPGGALKFGLDGNGDITDIKITIGAGYGFEISDSVPFPKK
jgi:RHS repeat-associated protein